MLLGYIYQSFDNQTITISIRDISVAFAIEDKDSANEIKIGFVYGLSGVSH